MENPKVCVVMPVYNGESTIELALKSLVAQSYKNWICVIVNDGSNDSTKEILNSLSDPRFRVYNLPNNMGRGFARQFALDHAEGDYLAYLDADDFYHKDKLRLQVSVLESDRDICLVATGLLAFGSSYHPINTRGLFDLKKSKRFVDRGVLNIVMPSAMIRLKQAKTISYNEKLNAGEDLDYFSRYLDGKYYSNINKVLLFYYVGPTTYKKMLQYSYNEILRGFYMLKEKPYWGTKVFLISIFKYLVYLFTIPVFGVDFFLKKRGSVPSRQELKDFYNQYDLINDEEICK